MMMGRREATFRKNLSIRYKTSLQADFALGVYTAWCQPCLKEPLVREVESHLQALKDEAAQMEL